MCYITCYVPRTPLPFSPSLVRISQPAVPVYSTITCLLGPHHPRGSCHISGGAHRRPRRGGRGCAEEERWPRQQLLPRHSWVDTWCTRPLAASCTQRTSCRALQASSSTSSSGAQVLRVRALTLCDAATDAFHGRHCHGLHALPTTILREHVR